MRHGRGVLAVLEGRGSGVGYSRGMSDNTARYYHDPDGAKARRREERIRELMADGADRFTCELTYDEEEAPQTTDHAELTAMGFDLPAAGTLDDAALSAKLGELVEELAKMGTFVCFTDHLSDRELYELLVREALRSERSDIPVKPGDGWVVDMTHYIADQDRADEISEAYMDDDGRRGPPGVLAYDRDRHLPHLEDGATGIVSL